MPRPSIPDPQPQPVSLIGPRRLLVIWEGESYVEIDPETGVVIGKEQTEAAE